MCGCLGKLYQGIKLTDYNLTKMLINYIYQKDKTILRSNKVKW